MKIGRWEVSGEQFEGWFDDASGEIICRPFRETSIDSLMSVGLEEALKVLALEAKNIDAGHRFESVKLRTPFEPKTVRDCVAFEAHVEGVVKSIDNSTGVVPEWYEYPTFYFSNPHTLIATGEVMTPPPSDRLDFELEVGVVIGGPDPLSNLTPEQGQSAIFGFTIFNDWSARDIQAREMKVRLGPSKGKDFASTIGPWIVTADELDKYKIGDFYHINMQVEVNGNVIGKDSLANIGWPLGELVAYASRNSRVKSGDLIGTGTAGGGGCLAELWGRNGQLTPPPLQPGDSVRMTIQGLGTIENKIGTAVTGPPIPPARRGQRTHV